MKLKFLSLLAIGMLFLASCNKTETIGISDLSDVNLIEAIQQANQQTIDVADVPVAVMTSLASDYPTSYIETAHLAQEFGYAVNMRCESGSQAGTLSTVYFSLKGKKLGGSNGYGSSKGHTDCFSLVFPVSFLMPDGTTLSGTKDELKVAIKDWYVTNPGTTEKASLVFPVEITFEDNTSQIVNDLEELQAARETCESTSGHSNGNGDHGSAHCGSCFSFVYPLSFTMPDGSTVSGDDKSGVKTAIQEWYTANPDSTEKPTLVFPVDLTFDDSTSLTVNSYDELQAAKESCESNDTYHGNGNHGNNHSGNHNNNHGKCFSFVYPVSYTMPDGSTVSGDDKSGVKTAIHDWYSANPDATEKPTLVFPLEIQFEDDTTQTINSQEELEAAKDDC